MLSQRLHEWNGPLRLEEVDEPDVWGDRCVLKVEACGVGLTVLNVVRGDLGSDPGLLPRIPGHEIAGTIVATGPEVKTLAVGDRVITYFYLTCGQCRYCRQEAEPLCERFEGFLGVHMDGGYADYTSVPERLCIPIPQELDPVRATTIPDAIGTSVHVCRSRARVRPEDRVGVLGAAGGVGAHMVQVVQAFGGDVLAIDRDVDKLKRLSDLASCDTHVFDELVDVSNEFDVVIDLVGRRTTLEWAAKALKKRGRLIILTTFPEVTFELHPARTVFAELEVLGSRYVPYAELDLAIQYMVDGRVIPVVSEIRPLEHAEEIHELLRTGRLFGRGAVVPYAEGEAR